jgi:hypothetical protein
MKVPGRIVEGGTITDPSSGTTLGLLQDVVLEMEEALEELAAAEFGIEPVDVHRFGTRLALTMSLRGFDADAVARRFSNVTTGTSGKPKITWPAEPAGTRASARGVVLRFVPTDHARHPGVIFYNAIPFRAGALDTDHAHDAERLMLAGFLAIRNGTGQLAEVALVEDMTP